MSTEVEVSPKYRTFSDDEISPEAVLAAVQRRRMEQLFNHPETLDKVELKLMGDLAKTANDQQRAITDGRNADSDSLVAQAFAAQVARQGSANPYETQPNELKEANVVAQITLDDNDLYDIDEQCLTIGDDAVTLEEVMAAEALKGS